MEVKFSDAVATGSVLDSRDLTSVTLVYHQDVCVCEDIIDRDLVLR